MSIEALIQAHTEALLANTEAVKLLTLSLAGRTPKPEEAIKPTGKPVDKKPKPEGVNSVLALEDDKPVVEVQQGAMDEQNADPVPYETVRALVLKIAGSNRAAIQALWVKYSIPNLKMLLDKEDDFNTVNDQAKLEAVYADLQALEG